MIIALLSGMVLCALVAAVLTVTAPGDDRTARAVGYLLAASGALLGLWAAISLGASPPEAQLPLPWPFPPEVLRLSGLSAGCALLAGALLMASGWVRASGAASGGAGTGLLLHGLLLAVAWFLASSAPLPVLAGWEAITVVSYLLLVRDRIRVRRAAWALLSLSEFGTGILLFALLVVTARGAALPPAWASALAVCALFAFGAKAGLFPLQVWVPLAEPEAPGDVAGLFSGLLTVAAVVGYLRIIHAVAPPLFSIGVVTAVFGLTGAALSVLLGLIERDGKRVLAYGTLEALGLSFTALGVGMVLQSRGAGSAAEMAIAGALTLLLAHAGGKFALFTIAGWLEQRSGLRLLDRMGGMLRHMPQAAGPLVVATFTLAALPPFGGFLGEWLLVEACLVPTPTHTGLHVVLAVLGALVAVVAAVGFTVYLRWIGIGFLGRPRTEAASTAPDVPPLATVGLWMAALVGAVAGIGAGWVLPWLSQATPWLAQGQPIVAVTYLRPQAYAPIVALGAALFRGVAGHTGNVIFAADGFNVGSPWDLACFALVLGLAVYGVSRRWDKRHVRLARTWIGGGPEDAGLAWTAEGLNHPLALTFAAIFALHRSRVPSGDPMAGGFRYRSRVLLRLEHHVYRPLLGLATRVSGAVRQTQSGDLAHYVGYIVGAALVGMAVVAVWR